MTRLLAAALGVIAARYLPLVVKYTIEYFYPYSGKVKR